MAVATNNDFRHTLYARRRHHSHNPPMAGSAFPVPSDSTCICRDYLKTPSVCARGTRCKFVHLEWTKKPSPDGAPFCIKDIFGKCDRGHKCNFFHVRMGKTPSVDPSSLAPDGRQYCIDYKRGICSKGDKCRFNHNLPMSRKRTSPSSWRSCSHEGSCREGSYGGCEKEKRRAIVPAQAKVTPPGLTLRTWPKTRIPASNPWSRDFRVANIRTFLESKEMDETKDEVFEGTNCYKKPIKPPKVMTSEDQEVEELLREPFSLFAKDPFILWRMEVESASESQKSRVAPPVEVPSEG